MAAPGAPGVWPKILLAKPAASRAEPGPPGGPAAGTVKLMRDRDEDGGAARARLPHGSLNLLTDSWDFSADRLLPLMTDNTDFTVVGVLGLPGSGKSTILNELYGFDETAPGVLLPFPVQSEEMKSQARHCTTGIEVRISSERFILLDTQPLYSSSVLMDLTRPDGSSTMQLLGGDGISAELALEVMGLQLGVFLTSICHVVLLVTEGLHDTSLWQLLRTVEMLKQGIPDPSAVGPGGQVSTSTDDISLQENGSDFFADAVFIHTKLRDNDLSYNSIECLKVALDEYFKSSAFRKNGVVGYTLPQFPVPVLPATEPKVERKQPSESKAEAVNFFVLPGGPDEFSKKHFESYSSMLRQLRDQILSMPRRSFVKPLNERDWLRNAARVWDLVKKSPVILDYGKMLQSSGLFKR